MLKLLKERNLPRDSLAPGMIISKEIAEEYTKFLADKRRLLGMKETSLTAVLEVVEHKGIMA